jgi:hypothetical protein
MKVIQGGKDFSQLSLINDTEEVIKFLEFAGKKLIFDEHAVQVRITACNNLFSVVNEEEDNLDYLLQNLDLLTHRFRNKNKAVSEDTLKVYKSRVKSSLEDYRSWSTDPFGWEKSVSERKSAVVREKKRAQKSPVAAPVKSSSRKAARTIPAKTTAKGEIPVQSESTESETEQTLSLPIRPGCTINIALPSGGLTLKDLHRLGMFLYPYCTDADDSLSPWSQGH